MLLTKNDITGKNIVQGGISASERHTSYDATIGSIIHNGTAISESEFLLGRRGVVWVVSKEVFKVPQDVTGLATLRTTSAHEGVFALNVGVVDPGWHGPIATALVNFGKKNVKIKKGDSFLRVLFLANANTGAAWVSTTKPKYIKEIEGKSLAFSDTFLDMTSLVSEVEKEVLKMPKWALYLAVGALVVSLLAVYAPISYTIFSDYLKNQALISTLEKRIEEIEERVTASSNVSLAPVEEKEKRTSSSTTRENAHILDN